MYGRNVRPSGQFRDRDIGKSILESFICFIFEFCLFRFH